ncbi:MAG: gliding motility-associated ABC transporter substrate-binding protein GldG [Cytophagales bacterium]|nr:MAG: gliding motility-associated ABC transporter substrate-binding protein GldG [Cytophagales bacterium]
MQTKKWEDILQFIAVFLLIVLTNIYAGRYFFRLDLTEEKRYTITEPTKEILKKLDDQVYIEVYLDGDLNAGFKRLQKSIRETLDEFTIYGGTNMQYKFVNPDEASSEADRTNFYNQLIGKGVQPTNLFDNQNGKKVEKIIFPSALITYKNKETPVQLLKGNVAASPMEQLNQSVENVEYELINAIKKITLSQKPSIAIIEGHDELRPIDMADLTTSLDEFYVVDRVNIQQTNLDGYKAIIVAQPKTRFSELEKYKLDQYIMNGGKALFFIDAIQMNLDSISKGGAYAFGYDLNINDMLFKYGIRINNDLIQDTEMGRIVVNIGKFGDQPNFRPFPWHYYVILNRFKRMPITKNLNGIYTRFLSTIDTIKTPNVQKTPLLLTNQYSRIRRMPNVVRLEEVRTDLDPKLYNRSFLPVCYLLEGKFSSLFKNRFAPDSADNKQVRQESVPTKIIVFSDGDIPRNEIDKRNGQPLPLGYDQLSQQTFSNKDFIMNALAYLIDENGLISSRNKEITLRPLDKFRVQDEKLTWQLTNMALPVAVIIGFGLLRFWWRKRKYEG